MKLLLEIKDNKAAFILEVLKNFTFVKTTRIKEKDILTYELEEAVKEVQLAKEGKLKTKPLNEFLDELPD